MFNKSTILLVIALLWVITRTSAQAVVDRHKALYELLQPYTPTGILIDRSPLNLLLSDSSTVGYTPSGPTTTGNLLHYESLYKLFYHASFSGRPFVRSPVNLPFFIDSCRYGHEISQAGWPRILSSLPESDVVMGSMFLHYDKIALNAFQSGYIFLDTTLERYKLRLTPYRITDTIWISGKPGSGAFSVRTFTAEPNIQKTLEGWKSKERLLYFTALQKTAYVGTDGVVKFSFPAALNLTNLAGFQLEVDFGDGAGFRVISTGQKIKTVYASGGLKTLKARLRSRDGVLLSDLTMQSELHVIKARYNPDQTFVSTAITGCTINTGEGMGEAVLNFRYAPGSGGKLRKPFILVEGFESSEFDKNNPEQDLPNGNGFGAINWVSLSGGTASLYYPQMELIGAVFDSLVGIGYDVGVVDFRTNRAIIEKNANALISLLEQVRDELLANNSQYGIQLMGASMGGLVARLALVKMEKAACCHAVKTYFTFSTPHRGANIPVSAQYLTHDLGYRYNLLGLGDRAKLSYQCVLNSPAARQMLVNHIAPDALLVHKAFYNKLDTLGHPVFSKKIAITDGSLNGFLHREKNDDFNSAILTELQSLFAFRLRVIAPTKVLTYVDFPAKKFNLIHADGRSVEHSVNAVSPNWIYLHGPDIQENFSDLLEQNLLWVRSAVELSLILTFHEVAKLAFPVYAVPITASQLVVSARSISRNEARLYQRYQQHHHVQNFSLFYLRHPSEGWDNAPGDINNTMAEISDEVGEIFGKNPFHTIFKTHTFVSAKSALDESVNSRMTIFDAHINNVNSSRFDYVWAKKEPLKFEFFNRTHVDVNFEFLKWLKMSLTALEDRFYLKENTVLNTNYNAACPAPGLINQAGHYFEYEFIPSLRVSGGTVLSLNRMLFVGPVGTVTNLLPKANVKSVFRTRSLRCTPVTVKNEGTVELGESMQTGFTNAADMRFGDESTLELHPNSVLRIHQGSRLTIQRGATLIVHPNASILLEGNNSVLEILGKVVLMPNAVFTFSGLGYVLVNQDSTQVTSMDKLWEARGNAEIRFVGSNPQQRLVQFASHMRLNPSIRLQLENGQVYLESSVVLDVSGPLYMDNIYLSAPNGQGYHKGLYLHGQAGVVIRNSRFSRGAPALTATMIQYRSPLELEKCQFYDNTNAVITYGGQVNFKNLLFELNQVAWHGYDIDGVSNITACEFYTNSIAIEVMGQHDANLNVSQNLIQDNSWGIRSFGQLHLRLNCNNISKNYTAIYAGNYQVLLGGRARNRFNDNKIAIRIEEVDNLFLYEGENDFSGSKMYITGNFSGIAMNYLYFNPITQAYELNIKDNSMPVVGGNTNMHMRDWNGDPVYARNYTPLPAYKPVCEAKQTTDFESHVLHSWPTVTEVYTSSGIFLLNEAISAALPFITTDDKKPTGNDLLAIEMLDEVLSDLRNRGIWYDLTAPEYVMLEIALDKMLEAHNNAYRFGLLTRARAKGGFPENEQLTKIISELNFRIEHAFAGYPFDKQLFSLMLAKAQAYRTAEQYDEAINALYELSSYGDDYWQGMATYWICICESEQQLILENISPEHFEELRQSCISKAPQLRKSEPELVGDELPEQAAVVMFAAYPNPATEVIILESSVPAGNATVRVTDMTGRMVGTYKWPDFGTVLHIGTGELDAGIYFLQIRTPHRAEIVRFVKQ